MSFSYSPKHYLEQLVKNNLDAWVKEFDESSFNVSLEDETVYGVSIIIFLFFFHSFQIGFFEGDINLSLLVSVSGSVYDR